MHETCSNKPGNPDDREMTKRRCVDFINKNWIPPKLTIATPCQHSAYHHADQALDAAVNIAYSTTQADGDMSSTGWTLDEDDEPENW
eukprot:9475017-Pyramimonas_sp.AAC.1